MINIQFKATDKDGRSIGNWSEYWEEDRAFFVASCVGIRLKMNHLETGLTRIYNVMETTYDPDTGNMEICIEEVNS